MLGLDWSELALIAVVAVVVIGPKDLPEAVRGVAKGIQKLRRMAGEFQGQVDEVVREAKLEDVRNQINEIRSFDFKSVVEKEIDKDGGLRKTFTEDPIGNPLKEAWNSNPASGTAGSAIVTPPPSPLPEAPAFVPPAFVPPGTPAPLAATPPPPPEPSLPPAFVPPAPLPAATAAPLPSTSPALPPAPTATPAPGPSNSAA
jgi:sec-independent protein translocase protein TatB